MNSNEAKKFLPLIVALSEGKTIQYFSDYFKDWKDTTSPEFRRIVQYRIKPEPRTFYGVEYPDGSCLMYATEVQRDQMNMTKGKKITVTEVL